MNGLDSRLMMSLFCSELAVAVAPTGGDSRVTEVRVTDTRDPVSADALTAAGGGD